MPSLDRSKYIVVEDLLTTVTLFYCLFSLGPALVILSSHIRPFHALISSKSPVVKLRFRSVS